jgi:hypothetical protein
MLMNTGRRSIWLLAAASLLAVAGPVRAGTVGGVITLTGSGCSFPDVAYSPEEDCYLAVWVDYSNPGLPAIRGRLIDIDAEVDQLVPQTPFAISDPADRSFYPAVTYNPTNREFLVTFDRENGLGQPPLSIRGRRIRASDGAPQGGVLSISTTANCQRSAAAWSTTGQRYVVVSSDFANVYAQRLNAVGGLIGGELTINDASAPALYPAVSWNPAADTFLVAWIHAAPGNLDYIRRRRISVGWQLLDDPLTITDGGHESHPTMAHDDLSGRWIVQYNDNSHVGHSFDQFARFIRDDGTPDGGAFPIADTPYFEGDTILGSDIAFAPAAGVYFSSFTVVPTGVSGQLSNRAGNRLRGQVVLGPQGPDGNLMRHSNAADTLRNRFLTVWDGDPDHDENPSAIYARLYAVANPVSNPSTTTGPARIRLCWTNPDDSEMTRVMIRFNTTAPPAGPTDGTLLADVVSTPGAEVCFEHIGLDHKQTYYYALFAHDYTPLYASGITFSARPALPGDFDFDTDVDQEDFGSLQACFSGDGESYGPQCSDADLDSDGDVDQNDFGVFRACMGGEDQPPGC